MIGQVHTLMDNTQNILPPISTSGRVIKLNKMASFSNFCTSCRCHQGL